ncbi:MAG: DUF433 domain-containing protein [Anaerolineae bacterium]|nr:MAG: DUF433 domain-containing protein [Anaerolineae bacterium]
MSTKTLDQYIERTPDVVGGKPRIAGHRITVQDVAIWHEWLGRSVDEIAAEYDLSLSEVYAALAYYHAHREEIDRQIKEDEDFIAALRREIPSKVNKKLHGA